MEQSETNNTPENSGNGSAGNTTGKAEERVREIGEKAREQAEGRVRDISGKARERASSYAGIAQQRLDGQRLQAASRIEGAASRLRQRADAAGPLGHKAGETAAQRMEAAAVYLQGHQSQEMAEDFSTYVQKHPIQSVIIAAIVGFLLGKLLG